MLQRGAHNVAPGADADLADEVSALTDWSHDIEHVFVRLRSGRLRQLDVMIGAVQGRSDHLRHWAVNHDVSAQCNREHVQAYKKFGLFIYLFIYFSEMQHSTYARYISTIKIWVVQ